jgi:hypothetical protein
MRHLIGPPGSGKRTVARGNPLLVDSELIPAIQTVYAKVRKRWGGDWWRAKEARMFKDKLMNDIRCQIETRLDYQSVLVSSDTGLVQDRDTAIVVIPTIEEILTTANFRHDGGFQYTSRADAEFVHDYFRRWAVARSYRVINSVIDAAQLALDLPFIKRSTVPSLEEIRNTQ